MNPLSWFPRVTGTPQFFLLAVSTLIKLLARCEAGPLTKSSLPLSVYLSSFKAFQTEHEKKRSNPPTLNHGLNSQECAPPLRKRNSRSSADRASEITSG